MPVISSRPAVAGEGLAKGLTPLETVEWILHCFSLEQAAFSTSLLSSTVELLVFTDCYFLAVGDWPGLVYEDGLQITAFDRTPRMSTLQLS